MKATIWHNPRCSKSREALAMLGDAGCDIEIIEYLKHPPDAETLAALYEAAGLSPAKGLRTAEPGAAALLYADDATILAAMAATPALIERPLVRTEKGVRLGRPTGTIREIL